MNKIINIFLIFIVSITWYFQIKLDLNSEYIVNEYIQEGDRYFQKGINFEAINSYKSAKKIKIIPIKNYVKALIAENQFEEALNELKNGYEDSVIYKLESEILDKLLSENKNNEFNKLLNIVSEKTKLEYLKNTTFKFVEYEEVFNDVKYNSSMSGIYIVKKDSSYDSWTLINSKGRYISNRTFEEIINVDRDTFTVIEDGKLKIFDYKNNLIGDFGEMDGEYKEGKFLKKSDKFQYFDRSGKPISKTFEFASNFENGQAIVKENTIKLINEKFEVIKEFPYGKVKCKALDCIFENKIILFDEKFKIYDIKENKYSNEFEDVDYPNNSYIAVKQAGKWSYINEEFEKINDQFYDLANSFTNDIACVIKNNEKFLINKNFEFEKLSSNIFPFNNEGISFIKVEGGYKMIRLVRER